MNGSLVVARRILHSLRGDRRTLGLVVVVPAFIVYLLSEVFTDPQPFAPAILGVFVFFLTYMLTAIGFLRERQAGTLERVLVSPVSRGGIVVGYVGGYGLLAAVQSLVLLGSAIYFLEVEFEHGIWPFFGLELLGALTALGIGIVLSLFARNEFQVIQFIPVVITPQVILGGTFLPVEELPDYLEVVARLMPITYLIDGMDYVVLDNGSIADLWTAVAVLVVFTEASIILADEVIRRAG